MPEVIFQEDDKAKTVMSYQPKKLSVQITTEAKSFMMSQPDAPAVNFRISDLVAQQTGIREVENATVEKRVEQKALEKLKEIQEEAYAAAHALGLEEGTKKGYEEAKGIVAQRLSHLNVLLEKFARIKVDILQRNEIQMVDFIYYVASKIAHFEISKNEQRIVPVLRHAMEALQKDESMLIKLAPEDFKQIEELRKIAEQDFEFLSKAKFEVHETIQAGGCVIETNYGLIDATLEERVDKLMTTLTEAKPNTKRDEFE